MELNLTWVSDDSYQVDKTETDPARSVISSCVILSSCKEGDYILKQEKKEKIIELFIQPTNQVLSDIKTLLSQGEAKEKRLSELKRRIEKIKEKLSLDKNKIEKLFLSYLKPKDKFYSVIEEKILENLIKSKSFVKDLKDFQSNITKMKTNKLITLFYKIFVIRSEKAIELLYKYALIFKANHVVVSTLAGVFNFLVKKITHELNEEIIEKIKEKDVFQKSKKDYMNYFTFMENNLEFFPVIRYSSGVSHSVVFTGFEDPKTLNQTETEFTILREIFALSPTVEKFKENVKEEKLHKDALSMLFNRDFELYLKMNVRASDLLYEYLLYEN